MSEDLYRRARELFLAVYELPPDERRERLGARCADNDTLRRNVESLLRLHDAASDATLDLPQKPKSEETPTQRFRAGDLFADRYRIVSLLGQGGMGQVYRAEDETLGVTVAVKVLPDRNRGGEPMLAEVRLAREITHPAICRIHDVGEWHGEVFITMEYVAGEDLASLLRRIGRLPPDKALDLARQLSAGLAAAHAQGVLHRDLKPGNILIDPEGRVRIADFGIAVEKESGGAEALAGTPGYLAPELLMPGQKATEQSDLYSLGVVLYELVTGRLPFDSARGSLAAVPTTPSAQAPGLEPRLEQAILRCLHSDASQRPASALELVSSLPGADALSLAAEVDVTPSPGIVAAAGDETALSSRTLGILFVPLFLLLGIVPWLGEKASFLEQAGTLKAPEVLLERARDVAEAAGFDRALKGRRFGYMDDPGAEALVGSSLFWVRQPVERQVPEVTRRYLFERPNGRGQMPLGWLRILLDPSGRLLYLESDAPPPDTAEVRTIDFSRVFELAGIRSELTSTEPTGPLPVFAEERRAWIVHSEGERLRVEAAMTEGRLVYFASQAMNSASNEIAVDRAALGGRDAGVQFLLILIALAAVPLAISNLKNQRGDLHGATHLALFVFTLFTASWWLASDFPQHPLDESGSLLASRLATLIQRCLWLMVGYLALEPSVRQVWPQTLIAWSRALEGRVRDALVGQSLMIGALAGALFSIFDFVDFVTPGLLGFEGPTAPLVGRRLNTALSPRVMLATAFTNVPTAIYEGLLMLMMLLLFRLVLKKPRLAMLAFAATFGALVSLTGGGNLQISWLVQGIPAAIIAITALRFGLLAYVVSRFVFYFLDNFPLTIDPELWYFESTFFAMGVVAFVAFSGFLMAYRGSSSTPALASRA